MKKLLFGMAAVSTAVVIALLFVACEGPRGPMGPPGHDGDGNGWYSTSFTVTENQWELVGAPDELNSYYVAYKAIPQLDNYVFNMGTVIVYIDVEGAKNSMPYVWHRGMNDGSGDYLWTETYDFDFMPGEMGFYCTFSDFYTGRNRPGLATFYVTLLW